MKREEIFRAIWPAIAFGISILAYTYHESIIPYLLPHEEQTFFMQLVMAASWYSCAWFLSTLTGIALRRKGNGRRRPKLLGELITAGFFLAATAATIAMWLGQSAGGALASSGLIIAIIGFAIRNVLADVLSGIALGLEAPFRIGDWIEIDGSVRGRVIEIGWRTTRLQTRNDIYMILPNSEISRQRMTNYSAPRKHYRAKLEMVLGHDIPVSQAKELLKEAARSSIAPVQSRKPDVRAISYDKEGVKYVVRYWVPSFLDETDCKDVLIEAIDKAIRQSGLPAPYSRVKVLSTANGRNAPEHGHGTMPQVLAGASAATPAV